MRRVFKPTKLAVVHLKSLVSMKLGQDGDVRQLLAEITHQLSLFRASFSRPWTTDFFSEMTTKLFTLALDNTDPVIHEQFKVGELVYQLEKDKVVEPTKCVSIAENWIQLRNRGVVHEHANVVQTPDRKPKQEDRMPSQGLCRYFPMKQMTADNKFGGCHRRHCTQMPCAQIRAASRECDREPHGKRETAPATRQQQPAAPRHAGGPGGKGNARGSPSHRRARSIPRGNRVERPSQHSFAAHEDEYYQ